MFRLFVLPITQLPPFTHMERSTPPMPPGVTCFLAAGPLPPQQRLEVSVNGVRQEGSVEEPHLVFSWQLSNATDEIRMTLLNQRGVVATWRGCWNERDALLHTGTLPIQVVFNGTPQSPTGTLLTGQPSSTGDGEERPKEAQAMLPQREASSGAEVSRSTTNVNAVSSDTAWDEENDDVEASLYAEEHDDAQPEEDEEGDEDEDDEENAQENAECTREEDAQEENAAFHKEYEGHKESEQTAAFATTSDHEEDRPPAPMKGEVSPQHPTGQQVATFHASPSEQAMQQLHALVAQMPPKTIIVDLREHRRSRKKYQERTAFSKDDLQAIFGAKYWDRGWAIKTWQQWTSPSAPPTTRAAKTAHTVLSTPEHPEGLPALVAAYQQGYSLVLIDSRAVYDESPRRAVVEALRQRLPALCIGSCR